VLVRLARTSQPAVRLARALAVLGDGADTRGAAALAGLDRVAAGSAADALAAAGIIEAGRPLHFIHPVVRNAIYADLPAGERAAAHERAARILADEHAEPERVAVHLLATDPGDDPAVAETLFAAAQRAMARAAPEAAVSYLRRALAESPPTPLRRSILTVLLMAGFRAAHLDAVEGIDPVAELTTEPETLIASAPMLGTWLVGAGRVAEMEAVLERAAAAARQAGDPEAAMRFELQRATWTQQPPRVAHDRLAPYAERLQPGSMSERVWLAVRAWWTSFSPAGSADEAGDLAARAVAGGEVFADLAGLPQGAQAILVLIRAERFDAAERALETFATEARAVGATPGLAGAAYLGGELARLRGDVARAATEARAAVEAGRQGRFLGAFPTWIALLVETLVELGELDAAEAELSEMGMAGPLPATYWFTPVLFSRAHLRLAQGRPRDALDDLLAGARDLDALGMVNTYYPWRAYAALAHAALGDDAAARAMLDAAVGPARAWGARAPLAALLRARGLVVGGEEGIGLLAEAVATVDGSAAGLERMRALAGHGAALRRAGRRGEAREPLRAALELARRGGAVAIARRAADELAATGERVRPLAASGIEALTPSERRVASMAAEGQSNREIAQALFLTVKTVETHLSNAYRKLDIRSRRELAGALAA
jgi:DNA-binding CsgD family transcriptional regulator